MDHVERNTHACDGQGLLLAVKVPKYLIGGLVLVTEETTKMARLIKTAGKMTMTDRFAKGNGWTIMCVQVR